MTYEQELIEELGPLIVAGTVAVEPSSDRYFAELEARFPTLGSKIDWKSIPGSIGTQVQLQSYIDDSLLFFFKICDKFNLSGSCIVINDSAFDIALIMTVDTLKSSLGTILNFPQHHYIVAQDCSWCMAFTMEGNVDFGRLPEK